MTCCQRSGTALFPKRSQFLEHHLVGGSWSTYETFTREICLIKGVSGLRLNDYPSPNGERREASAEIMALEKKILQEEQL